MERQTWLFRLYVAGTGWLASSARANLERLCLQHVRHPYRIEVIDLLKDPTLARQYEVVALPMVVRETPVPIRKAVGDFSKPPRELFVLGRP